MKYSNIVGVHAETRLAELHANAERQQILHKAGRKLPERSIGVRTTSQVGSIISLKLHRNSR